MFKNITLYSIGKFISAFGTYIYTFCISLFILKYTSSGLFFSLNLVISLIPTLLINPIAGVIVDRVNKKKLVIIMDFLSGFVVILFYIITLYFGILLSFIYIVTFLLSTIACFFDLGFESSMPNLVDEKELIHLNSISRIIAALSSILGPVLGGIFYAYIDLDTFLLINGLSFIFSAILELFINFNYNKKIEINEEEEQKEKINMFTQLKDGITLLKTKKEITPLILFFILINFFTNFSIMVPYPYIIIQLLKLKSLQYGIIEGAIPIGFIIGALSVSYLYKRFNIMKLFITITLLISLFMCCFIIPHLIPQLTEWIIVTLYASLALCFGLVLSIIDIAFISLLQKNIDEAYRGRILSIIMMLAKVTSPLALLLSGAIINPTTAWFMPVVGGGILLLFSLYKVKNIKSFSSKECVSEQQV